MMKAYLHSGRCVDKRYAQRIHFPNATESAKRITMLSLDMNSNCVVAATHGITVTLAMSGGVCAVTLGSGIEYLNSSLVFGL
jgi:hypothetical protein